MDRLKGGNMASYTHEYSNFPNALIELTDFQDIDDSLAPLVNKIQYLQSQGKMGEAAKLIRENSDLLGNRIVGSAWYNMIIEEIRNAEIYALQAQQHVYTCEEEPDCLPNDIWIGG